MTAEEIKKIIAQIEQLQNEAKPAYEKMVSIMDAVPEDINVFEAETAKIHQFNLKINELLILIDPNYVNPFNQ
jgi:hypothetical protein